MRNLKYILLLGFVFSFAFAKAQSDKKSQLERRRAILTKEIKQVNQLLRKNRSEEKSVVTEVESLEAKIIRLEELIRITNQEANYLTRQINTNQKRIGDLRKELKTLKADYARMIQASYKSRNSYSRVMFLLSSKDFLQGYKRIQYMKQYTDYRKRQAKEIERKTLEMQERNKDLLVQRKDQKRLIAENKKSKRELDEEIKLKEQILASTRDDQKKLETEVRNKQNKARAIDREIRSIIDAAIAKSGGSKSGKFILTPAAKKLAKNFVSNKGKLPWPVKEGVVTRGFGPQRSPIAPQVPINSTGLRIETGKGGVAQAIFEGEVIGIASKNGILTIMIQHGNYITVYKNLAATAVEKGDKVFTGDDLGTVYTSARSNTTELHFAIFKDNTPIDPEQWILRL